VKLGVRGKLLRMFVIYPVFLSESVAWCVQLIIITHTINIVIKTN